MASTAFRLPPITSFRFRATDAHIWRELCVVVDEWEGKIRACLEGIGRHKGDMLITLVRMAWPSYPIHRAGVRLIAHCAFSLISPTQASAGVSLRHARGRDGDLRARSGPDAAAAGDGPQDCRGIVGDNAISSRIARDIDRGFLSLRVFSRTTECKTFCGLCCVRFCVVCGHASTQTNESSPVIRCRVYVWI